MSALIDQSPKPQILISMDQVESVSSSMIGQIFAMWKKAKAKKGELQLVNLHGEVRAAFAVTQLDKKIKIYDDLEAALKSYMRGRLFSFLRKR